MSLIVPVPGLVGSLPLKMAKDTWSGPFGAETLTRVCQVPYTPGSISWSSALPAEGDSLAYAPWMKFRSFAMKQRGKCAEVTLTYEQDPNEDGGDLPELPPESCSEDVAGLELDITRHPRFLIPNPAWNNLSLFDLYNPLQDRIFFSEKIPPTFENAEGISIPHPKAGEDVPEEVRGMSRYVVGSTTVRCQTYSYNQPASVQGLVGTRETPSGYSGTDWLILSGSRTPLVGYWCRELVYQFSARTISSWVYP